VGVEGGIPADPNNQMYIYGTLIGPGPTSFGYNSNLTDPRFFVASGYLAFMLGKDLL